MVRHYYRADRRKTARHAEQHQKRAVSSLRNFVVERGDETLPHAAAQAAPLWRKQKHGWVRMTMPLACEMCVV